MIFAFPSYARIWKRVCDAVHSQAPFVVLTVDVSWEWLRGLAPTQLSFAWARVENRVPLLLMRAIAEHIRRNFLPNAGPSKG